jgi:hypothetical protein
LQKILSHWSHQERQATTFRNESGSSRCWTWNQATTTFALLY